MPTREAPAHIVIIGGGITGLTAALHMESLAQASGTACRLTLLEASSRLGGKLFTEHVSTPAGEFIVDAGPDIFMASKPQGTALCTALGLTDQLLETDPDRRITYVREGETLTPVTMYEHEPLVTLRTGIQTLADAAANALSQTTIRRETTVEGLIWNQTAGRYTIELYTTDGAPRASSDHAPVSIETESIEAESIEADAVILAVPARTTVTLLSRLIPNAAELLSSVSYTTTTTVSVGYREQEIPRPLDGYGYIVRNPTPGGVSACTWSSTKIPGRAPRDHALIRAFVRSTDLTDDALHALVFEEFRQTLGITAEPLFVRAYAWPEAIPIYGADHAQHIDTLDANLTPFPHLIVTGSAIHATGIPDSIRLGTEAADAIWRSVVLGESPTRPRHSVEPRSMTNASRQLFFAR